MATLRHWFHSLHAQLVLWAVLPIILVVIGLAFTGVYTHQQAMLDFVIERDRVLVDLVTLRLQEALVREDLTIDGRGLEHWLPAGVDRLPAALLVLTREGEILAKGGQMEIGADEARLVRDHLATTGGGSTTLATDSGASIVLTSSEVPGVQWTVMVWAPSDDLLGPILRYSGLGPIAAALAAGVAIFVLVCGWRTIVRPLQQLSQAAEAVSWGDRTGLGRSISGVMEIQELHAALAHMIERLEGYQTGVLDYLDAVTQGQEAERARLAHELHDGPVQSLVALGHQTEMLRIDATNHKVSDVARRLDDLREAEIGVVDDLRRIIGAIRPVYLDDLGFLPALEAMVHSADARDEAAVHLKVETDMQRVPPDLELAAYRITQEALTNALQHAKAERVDVTVRFDPGRLTLRVADDGCGFQPATRLDRYTRAGHFGLVGLQERVRQLDGIFTIASAPGVGTVVDVRLPLP